VISPSNCCKEVLAVFIHQISCQFRFCFQSMQRYDFCISLTSEMLFFLRIGYCGTTSLIDLSVPIVYSGVAYLLIHISRYLRNSPRIPRKNKK
jgi:hypothetical protein